MKAISSSLLSLTLFGAVSCSKYTTPIPAAPAADPFQDGANSYGVPGAYNPAAGSPYQPINPPADQAYTPIPAEPVSAVAPQSDTSGQIYTIQKGDTLWGLSRRYGVSIDAIRQANGMGASDNNIILGNTLQIPGS